MPTTPDPGRPGVHTAVKHELLVRYLDVWTPTVLRASRRATYAEGYAGSGLRPGGGGLTDAGGSALAALRAFGEYADHLQGRRLDMVLVDEDPDRLRTLAGLLAATHAELRCPPELSVHTVPGTCADDLVPWLEASGALGTPLLAYLDSVGAAAPPFDVVAAIAGHRASEVLLTLDPRLMAQLAAGQCPPETGDQLFGGGHWRDVTERPLRERYPYLVTCYRESLRRTGLGHVLHVELVDAAGEAQLLAFATASAKSLERLKDELWAVDEYAGVRYRDPRDSEHSLLDISLSPYLGPLRRDLAETVAAARECTVADLRRHTLEETVYRTPDTNHALNALLAGGELTRRPEKGRLTAETVIVQPG